MQWPILTLLAIVLVVLGVAIGAGFRPLFERKPAAAPASPAYTDQQVADAKAAVCTAFDEVAHALDIAKARDGGDDPTAQLGVATSGQLVLEVGSRYLLTKLAEEPAAPPNLARAVRTLANTYQELTVGYQDRLNESDVALRSTLQTGDEAAAAINGICK